MKEQLQGKLVEILTSIQGAVGKASDFAMDQIPDIAYQFMRFQLVWSAVEFVLCAILVLGMIKLFRFTVKRYKETDHWDNDGWAFASIGSFLVGVVGLLGMLASLYTLMLIWIAPKVWLIKELAGMIK